MLEGDAAIFRDPSSILIAFFMPGLMLFIFGFGINLDFSKLRIGLWLETAGAEPVLSLAR